MIWRIEELTGLFLLTVFFCAWLYRKSNLLIALIALSTLFSALMVSHNPQVLNHALDLKLRLVSARSFMTIVMLLFFTAKLSKDQIVNLWFVIEWVAVLNALLIIIFNNGFFNAYSADMAFVMAVFPAICFRPHIHPWVRGAMISICVGGLLSTTGSTAFFALFCGMVSYFLVNKKWLLVGASVVVTVTLGIYMNTNATNFFTSPDRVSQWVRFFDFLVENKALVFGTGTGTFQWLGPMVQGGTENLFTWAHNEFLQILFEQGAVILIFSLVLIFLCLFQSLKLDWLFAVNMAFLMTMLTQFPLRFFVGQVMALTLVRVSLEDTSLDHVF